MATARAQGTRLWRALLLGIPVFGFFPWLFFVDCRWLQAVGFALLPLVFYAGCVLLLPPLRRHRPPPWTIRLAGFLSLLALPIWIASLILVVDFVVGPDAKWSCGRGAVTHVPYGAGGGRSLAPGLCVKFDPSVHGVLDFASIAMLDGRWGSSREVTMPIWPLAAATGASAWVLWRVRRERIPPGTCEHCGYDLTGNVSGQCPECGAAARPSDATHS